MDGDRGEDVRREVGLEHLPQYNAFAVPVASIYYDAGFNCRADFTLQSVEDLAESIRSRGGGVELKGLEYPIVVQPIGDVVGEKPSGFDYRLVAGHRRFKAIEGFLKWSKVPAMVRSGLSDREARMHNFVENLERKDLNPLEEATALKRLYPDGAPLRVAARELKRPTRWVHDRFRLLTLPEEVQQLAAVGLLAMCQLEALIGKPPSEQIRIARQHATVKRERGKTASLRHLGVKERRKFGRPRTKSEMHDMIAKLLGRGITGLAPRMGAWCAGYISSAEFEKDIRNHSNSAPNN